MKMIYKGMLGIALSAAVMSVGAAPLVAEQKSKVVPQQVAAVHLSAQKETSLLAAPVLASTNQISPPGLCAKLARLCDAGNQNACAQYDRICEPSGT
jgi:hypothetical protein